MVNTVKDTTDHILKEFPSLFKGLGNLGNSYYIKMREGLHPYALFTPRNVPIPRDLNLFLLKRVRGQLKMSDFQPKLCEICSIRRCMGNKRQYTDVYRKYTEVGL